jgi:TonB family protein
LIIAERLLSARPPLRGLVRFFPALRAEARSYYRRPLRGFDEPEIRHLDRQVPKVRIRCKLPTKPRSPGMAHEAEFLPSLFTPVTLEARLSSNFARSLGIHAAGLAMLLAAYMGSQTPAFSGSRPLVTSISFPDVVSDITGRDSGGGQRDKLPVSKGMVATSTLQPIVPPTPKVRESEPLLPVTGAVLGNTTLPQLGKVGLPNGVAGLASAGPGCCQGLGLGNGPSAGNGTAAVYSPGGNVSAPVPIYQPDPEYSEEARKLKMQGAVLVRAIVGTDGHVLQASVEHPLGYGLDERALQSVRSWRFKPAMKDGRLPVAVQVYVSVDFRLF